MKKITKTITKELAMKAVMEEPLRQGDFFSCLNYETDMLAAIDTCDVCAVGAVLRQASFTKSIHNRETLTMRLCRTERGYAYWNPIWYFDNKKLVKLQIKEGSYLPALSVYFENLDIKKYPVSKGIRVKLAKFIEKNFPEKFEVTL